MSAPFLLSVIIPCYNCQDYIYECLQSVCSQVDDSVEIIVINDGSTDNSLKEIESFIKKATQTVRVISQKNQGISIARNNGIEASSGKYIALLDGDDLWTPSFWEKIRPVIENGETDLIEFNIKVLYEYDNKMKVPLITSSDGHFKINSISDLRETFLRSQWYAWARVYKKDLFNEFKFPAGRRYEDVALLPKIYLSAKEIHRITDELVLYRIRQGSITTSTASMDVDDIIYALSVFKELANGKTKDEIEIISPSVYTTYNFARKISKRIYGYCFFNNTQIHDIKKALKPYFRTQKTSRRIRLFFIREFCLVNKFKYKLRLLAGAK
ncbi:MULTISPECIES: glycosyltransferase family 2 protein [unclassified Citrobacter]|uniref:glycosyltransferase family 2 protein n=1 Tax=unclassified Citrobacter TaxID=2644389 RepID=UPI0025781642|nr:MULTISPECIES: glycosyltransferase family 2 protein [unclassified Citrobacter]MDM3007569.1 glycosyltransferase [Citrobacter sp. CK191]MDM3132393.1 glycosyltransferase [Citrobacter sp. CK205]